MDSIVYHKYPKWNRSQVAPKQPPINLDELRWTTDELRHIKTETLKDRETILTKRQKKTTMKRTQKVSRGNPMIYDEKSNINKIIGQKAEQTERQKQKEDIQDSEGFQVDFSYEPIWTKMNN